ncbi:MAG: diadenylate cyclase CdaA [Chloroflexota bacterium]|nr:diadenylate cyclase CdaA [Chloroflexota bacterium]
MDELRLLISHLSDWQTIVDILLVALVIYGLLHLFRGTRAVQVLRGIVVVALGIALITSFFQLTAFSWLVRNATPALLVTIPIIFQPELRRALERLGRSTPIPGRNGRSSAAARLVDEVVQATSILSRRRHGALIVFEGDTGLQEYIETGVPVDGEVSSRLLQTIFFPGTALHDGAVFVRGSRVLSAAAVLPLTGRQLTDVQLGTRHRAAIGITEGTDALTVVVSEESGAVSVVRNGRMVRRLNDSRLRKILQNFVRA